MPTATSSSRLVFASVIAVSLLALAACNTMQGMGTDIRNAGEALGTTAKKTQDKMNGE